jgi:DNA-binding MarR family transcriptional regulator
MTNQQPTWKIFALCSGIYLKTRRITERALQSHNLTWPQFGALITLSQQDNITQKELATRLESDTTTAMVLCDSLQKRGYIQREKDPLDRRVNKIKLTEQGRVVFSKAYPLVEQKYELIASQISPEEITLTLPGLERLYSVIKRHYNLEIEQ